MNFIKITLKVEIFRSWQSPILGVNRILIPVDFFKTPKMFPTIGFHTPWLAVACYGFKMITIAGHSLRLRRGCLLSGDQRVLNFFQLSMDFPGFGYPASLVRLVAHAF